MIASRMFRECSTLALFKLQPTLCPLIRNVILQLDGRPASQEPMGVGVTFTRLSNPGCNTPAVAGSKLVVVHNRPAEAHNRRAAHNTVEDNTPAVAGNRDTPGRC
jgi:hypothetical protein